MMAPDYAHWHGMYEVAERFYQELIPQAREIAEHAAEHGHADQAQAVLALIDDILDRPEHQWFEQAKKLAEEGKASVLPGAEQTANSNNAQPAESDTPSANGDSTPAATSADDDNKTSDSDSKESEKDASETDGNDASPSDQNN